MTTTTDTRTPPLSGLAKQLLEAVDTTDLTPDEGWGFYLPNVNIGRLWTAKDRLLHLGYVRDGDTAAGEQVLVITSEGRDRLYRIRQQRTTDRAVAAERKLQAERVAAVAAVGGAL